jgi:hypothetical protein
MPSNRRWRRRPAADAEKKSRSPSKAKPGRIEQHEGELNWATSGGDGDERWQSQRITMVKQKRLTRRSKCPAWRRQSSPELARIGRQSRRRFEIAREERGLGLARVTE